MTGTAFRLVALAAAALAAYATAAPPDAATWVDMTTGGSGTRIFLDTASVKATGNTRTANVLFIDDLRARGGKIEFDCAKRTYRPVGGTEWANDDPANVRRACAADYAGLQRFARKDLQAIVDAKTGERRWIEVAEDQYSLHFLDTRPVSVSGSKRIVRTGSVEKASSLGLGTSNAEVDCATRKTARLNDEYKPLVPQICRGDFTGRRLFSAAELRSYRAAVAARHSDLNGTFIHPPSAMNFPLTVAGLGRTEVTFAEDKQELARIDYKDAQPVATVVVTYEVSPLGVDASASRSAREAACAAKSDVRSFFEGSKAIGEAKMDAEKRRPVTIGGVNYFNVTNGYTRRFRKEAEWRFTNSAFCDLATRRVVSIQVNQHATANTQALIDRLVAEGPWPGRRF